MKKKKKIEEVPFENPIDSDKITENPHNLEYGHHSGSALIKPEDEGKLKSRALKAMDHQTDMQLGQIYEQMKLLASQAQKLNERKKYLSLFIKLRPVLNPSLTIHIIYINEKMVLIYYP